MKKKTRVDQTLVERGFFESRERAQRAIMAGEVRVGDHVFAKAAELVDVNAPISVAEPRQFASRGALKLSGALDFFGIEVRGKTALDIGASTGGFTDCLLQRGAAKVFAVDVGHGQLAWKLRNDPRVMVMEKINARFLSGEHVSDDIDLCVIDVSFISLTLRGSRSRSCWRRKRQRWPVNARTRQSLSLEVKPTCSWSSVAMEQF